MKVGGRERRATIATAASLAPVVWIYGVTTGVWALAIPLLAVLFLAALVPNKRPATAEARTLGSALSILVGIGGTIVFPPVRTSAAPEAMPDLLAGTALTALALGTIRTCLDHPRWGHGASVAIGLLALVSCGAVPQQGQAFVLVVFACLGAGAAALHYDDRGRPVPTGRGARALVATALVVGGSIGFTIAMAEALPRLQRIAENRWFDRMADRQGRGRAGFGVRFQLGDLTSILESDEVALRVIAPATSRPALLRGIAYGRYQYGGHWFLPHVGEGNDTVVSDRPPDSADRVEVQNVGGVEGVFLPVLARNVATPGGLVRADPSGVLRAPEKASIDQLWYRPGPRDRFEPGPPLADDLRIPGLLEPALDRVLAEWIPGPASARERLDAIQHRLVTDFRYSLRSERSTQSDPTIDFLTANPVGHCEYFASAMALLARKAGIPARVVGGYRVTELNTLGGFMVVRERDAHAWVEAWVEGEGWRTYDPTPGAALDEARKPDSRSARWELLAERWWRFRQAVDLELMVMGILGSVLAFLVTRDLWNRRKGRAAGVAREGREDGPLPCYELLAGALALRGVERVPGETLHRFAERVEASTREGPAAGPLRPVAAWIRSYAALRYGGLGEAADLEARARPLVAALSELPPRESPPA